MNKPFTIIESPWRDNDRTEHLKNIQYAQACVRDSISRGELPFASHLLYTQTGILDDSIEEERELGISLNLMMIERCAAVAIYTERGISDGMLAAIRHAEKLQIPMFYRTLKA